MTTANLKLATVSVLMEDKLETPDQQLDEGEFIVKRIVALQDLENELKGENY
jgi:ADP-ribose pyrophosphatase